MSQLGNWSKSASYRPSNTPFWGLEEVPERWTVTYLNYSLSYEVETALIGKSSQFSSFPLAWSLKRCNGINDSAVVTNFVLKYTLFLNILPLTPFAFLNFPLTWKMLAKFTNEWYKKFFVDLNGRQLATTWRRMPGVANGWPRVGQHRETGVAKRWPMW